MRKGYWSHWHIVINQLLLNINLLRNLLFLNINLFWINRKNYFLYGLLLELHIIMIGRVLCPKISQLLRNRFLFFTAGFRTIWFDLVLPQHISIFFRECFWTQICICCITFNLRGSFSGRSDRTWSRWKGRWDRFDSVNSYSTGRVWLWFWVFCIRLCFTKLFSYFSWQFLYLFRCCIYLPWVLIWWNILLEEEIFDVLVLNIFAFRKDVEDR